MVRFEGNELEVALVTYNRAPFVAEWFDRCFDGLAERGISVSVYDSSTDDETEEFIRRFNSACSLQVRYVRISPDTIIGYKPMCALLESKAKYLWVAGDSRYQDLSEMDEKVFPLMKCGVDFATFYPAANAPSSVRIYNDMDAFLYDAFVSSTCIGMSVFRVGLFDSLRENDECRRELDSRFKGNYGFAWLGYLYTMLAEPGRIAAYVSMAAHDILPAKKTQTWAKRFYGCWCEDLCWIIDNLPDSYARKDAVPRHVWKVMGLDSIKYCCRARIGGDLRLDTVERLLASGMLGRCTDKVERIMRFSKYPIFVARCALFAQRTKLSLRKILRCGSPGSSG